jgi:hypothetical protein
MTLPGFVDEEDHLQDGKRIQRVLSHTYELPSLIDAESTPSKPTGMEPGRNPAGSRTAVGRKSGRGRPAGCEKRRKAARREK